MFMVSHQSSCTVGALLGLPWHTRVQTPLDCVAHATDGFLSRYCMARLALPLLCEASSLPRHLEACAIPFSRTAAPCGRGTPLCQGRSSGLRGSPGLRATAPRQAHGEGSRCGTSGCAADARAHM